MMKTCSGHSQAGPGAFVTACPVRRRPGPESLLCSANVPEPAVSSLSETPLRARARREDGPGVRPLKKQGGNAGAVGIGTEVQGTITCKGCFLKQ